MDEKIKELEKIIEAKDKTFREFYEKTQKAHELHIKKVFDLMETIKKKDIEIEKQNKAINEAREIINQLRGSRYFTCLEATIWLEENKNE